jgi:hypothetical protein
MMSWIIWLVRVAAAFLLVSLAVVLLIGATGSPDSRALFLGMAAVFGIAGVAAWPRVPNAWRKDPPTPKQLAYAERLGLDVPARISKGELSDMISSVTGR